MWFDKACPDRGYAYVGASRVRAGADLWLMGRARRTDWLPVGGDPDGEDETRRSVFSGSYDSNE